MANPPPLPSYTGRHGKHGRRGKKGGLPPLPGGLGSGGSKGPSKSKASSYRAVTQMFKGHGYPMQYRNLVFEYAKAYGIDPVYVAAVLLNETNGRDPDIVNSIGARGLAQILDPTLGNYNNSGPLGWAGPNGVSYLKPGQKITKAMANSPSFAIAYVAWRMSGEVAKYGWPNAYTQHYGGHGAPDPSRFIPGWYSPSSSSAGGSGVTQQNIKNIATSTVTTKSNPFVIYKNGKISYTWTLTNNVLEYDGVPVTKSLLDREVQDKAGIGGDYYNFTGRSPSPAVVAHVMSSGKNLQQIENQWINHTQTFKNSPAGKKYQAGYQDAWSQVMGKNQPIPWQLVQEAAQSNLNETEFAAKLRMDGFEAQKDNPKYSYLQSNEYQSRVDAYTLSYQKIYGEHMQDPGFKNLASDAALAGWDPTQWEAYLRSLPQYTSTREYQGHAMGVLDQLGMDFGMEFGLGQGGYTPQSGAQELPGPPGDKRIDQGKQEQPGATDNNLGVQVVTA